MLRFFTLLILTLSTYEAYGQTAGSLDLVAAKVKAEESISKRLTATIGTVLEKDSFEVSVQADIVEAASKPLSLPVRDDTKARGELPLDDPLTGLINAETLIRNYEEEIDNLKVRNEIITQKVLQETKKNYEIRGLSIQVGLQESYGEEYAKEFLTWLTKNTTKDFKKVEIDVSLIRPKPAVPEKKYGFYDYLSQLQILIAASLIFIMVLIAILLIKRLPSRDATEERALKAQLQQQLNNLPLEREVTPIDQDESKSTPLLQAQQHSSEDIALIKEVHKKILWTIGQETAHIQNIVNVWFSSGESEYIKAACLLDVLISNGEKLQASDSLNFSQLVPDALKSKMREIFEQATTITFEERVKTLDKVYWDLLSLKTLGPTYLQRPFDFISTIPTKEIIGALSSHSSQIKALAILHLPTTKQKDFFESSPYEIKKEILQQTLGLKDVLTTDVEMASETLKYEIKQKSSSGNFAPVSTLVPKLFSALSPLDELLLLKDIVPNLSDLGRSIKCSVPSLAFITDWPKDKIELLFAQANSDEILAYIRVYPEKKEQVLELCPSRVKTIVQDDLALQDSIDIKTKNKHLLSLKLKMMKFINSGEVDLAVIFTEDHLHEDLHAA